MAQSGTKGAKNRSFLPHFDVFFDRFERFLSTFWAHFAMSRWYSGTFKAAEVQETRR